MYQTTLLQQIDIFLHNTHTTGRKCSHAAGVVKRLQGPEVPPRWRKSVLQEVTAALAGGLEELDVAPQPRLGRKTGERATGEQGERPVDSERERKRETRWRKD